MGSKVDKLRYDHNYLQRTFNKVEMGLMCFCALHGFAVYKTIPTTVACHGGILLVFFWIGYGIITMHSAACMAELTALVPSTGGTYHYCYYTICEFFAFMFGWNSILGYSALILSRCTFISSFVDHTVFNGWMSSNVRVGNKSCHNIICYKGRIDIFVPVLILSTAFFATWSIRIAKHVTSAVTAICVIIMFVIQCCLIIYSEYEYIKIWGGNEKGSKIQDLGETVFFGFIGYETIAVLGEEAENPSETIPQSIITSLLWTLMVYILLTMFMAVAVTENDQYGEYLEITPLSSFLKGVGLGQIGWLSNIGAILGFWGGAYTMLFTIIRIMYSMARDGMIFNFFSSVQPVSRTPILPAMVYGTVLGLLGAFIDIDHRAATFSFAVGKALTSICLLVSRYRCERIGRKRDFNLESRNSWLIINYPNRKTSPTWTTHKISLLLIYLSVMSAISTAYCILVLLKAEKTTLLDKSLALLSFMFLVIFMTFLNRQPKNGRETLSFQVPNVPNVPAISIIFEFITAIYFTTPYWLLAAYWSLLGTIFYFAYSIVHSRNNTLTDSEGERWNPWRRKKREQTIDTESDTSSEDIEASEPEEILKSMGIASYYKAEDFFSHDPAAKDPDSKNIELKLTKDRKGSNKSGRKDKAKSFVHFASAKNSDSKNIEIEPTNDQESSRKNEKKDEGESSAHAPAANNSESGNIDDDIETEQTNDQRNSRKSTK